MRERHTVLIQSLAFQKVTKHTTFAQDSCPQHSCLDFQLSWSCIRTIARCPDWFSHQDTLSQNSCSTRWILAPKRCFPSKPSCSRLEEHGVYFFHKPAIRPRDQHRLINQCNSAVDLLDRIEVVGPGGYFGSVEVDASALHSPHESSGNPFHEPAKALPLATRHAPSR